MIQGMLDTGSTPVLERLVQFTGERHRHLVNNVANLSTPNFQPRDLSVADFQKTLSNAVDERRRRTSGLANEFRPQDTRQVTFREGGLETRAQTQRDNILFHDRNNRSVEHAMKELAENAMTHNAAIELLRSKFASLETALRERL